MRNIDRFISNLVIFQRTETSMVKTESARDHMRKSCLGFLTNVSGQNPKQTRSLYVLIQSHSHLQISRLRLYPYHSACRCPPKNLSIGVQTTTKIHPQILRPISPPKTKKNHEKHEKRKQVDSTVMATNTSDNAANDNKNYTIFKYIITGDMGVGKSCLLSQFTENKCKLFSSFVCVCMWMG